MISALHTLIEAAAVPFAEERVMEAYFRLKRGHDFVGLERSW